MGRTWRIGEVAERTGLTRRTLRHYDELGLLVPSSRSWGDYRLYDEADLLRLLQIQNLKALGLSLAEIATALADPDLDAGATLRSHLAHVEDRIEAERRLADRLRGLAGSAERSWEDVLDAIALVRQLDHSDPTVRIRAAFTSSGTTPELLDALRGEPDPAVQEVLVWALARQPDSGPAALAGLDDPDPNLRCLMVRLLAKRGEVDAAPALVRLLDDPVPRVVANAVQSLGTLAAPGAASAVARLIGAGIVPDADLLDALGAIGGPAVEPLSEALATGDAAVRAVAAEALGRIAAVPSAEPAGRIRALLEPLLADPDHQVRISALLALGELGAPARPAIEGALADPGLTGLARRLLDLPPT